MRRNQLKNRKIGSLRVSTGCLTRKKLNELGCAFQKARNILKMLKRSRQKTRVSIYIPSLKFEMNLMN